MRKWLDKAWAKAAAFVLTLVLGGLTVLGGIGIGILVSYNVFLDDGAYLRQTLYQEQCYDSLSMANGEHLEEKPVTEAINEVAEGKFVANPIIEEDNI